MRSTTTYITGIILAFTLLSGLSTTASAQETDTSKVELKKDDESPRKINLNSQLDRSISGGSMTEMGTYQVPNEGQYYKPPFKGQEHLDKAVEAYRKQMGNKLGDSWFWQILRAVSPFIRLEMSALDGPEMQFVGRDNPLFQNYGKDDLE